MALGTTPFARTRIVAAGFPWPLLFEALFTLAAIGALVPLFQILSGNSDGRDGRFAEERIAVSGLPQPVVPALCESYGALAEPFLRQLLCSRAWHDERQATDTRASNGERQATDSRASYDERQTVERIPATLADANARTRAAFGAPVAAAKARVDELQSAQRDGLNDLLPASNAVAAVHADLQPFLQRFAIDPAFATAPLPLACAYGMLSASLAIPDRRGGDVAGIAARANALLLLGAAIDGDRRTPALANAAMLPDAPRTSRRACSGAQLADALGHAATIMADARHAAQESAKNAAMRALIAVAGWYWAAAMLLGLALLHLSRRRISSAAGVALSLATWAIAAWVAGVPWPFASDRAFVPARDAGLTLALPAAFAPAGNAAVTLGLPAPFVLGLLILAAIFAALALVTRHRYRSSAQTIATRVGYPGFVLATGLGWLVLIDLSANGNLGNRYLALYHQGHLWFAMLLLTVIAFVRQPLGRALAWTLSMIDGLAGNVGRRLGPLFGGMLASLFALVLIAAFAALLTNLRQVTSELGRLWLMIGASWFFFLRGTPIAERIARSGASWLSLVRYVMPLAFVVGVLVGAMLLTRDMGPLLVAGYAAGGFVAASAATWIHQRYGALRTATFAAITIFVGWIATVTFALFRLGAVDDVTAARLENLSAPLASANDQLALVTWFQHASPQTGYGLGAVPWCGYGGSIGCAGVPAQIQSDYTFTALVGAFGSPAAWAITIGCALWLHRLIRHHGRITAGEPRFVMIAGRMVNDEQALLSWLAVTWVVLSLCQLGVTVAGNLAVIPLTGVTFPFVSFGMTSLLVNVAMLALCLNVNVSKRAAR